MPQPLKPSPQPRIALALSGGAARGIAHAGVLRALTEQEIPIHCIAGTSAGAIVGGAFASGMTVSEIEAIGLNMRWRDVDALQFRGSVCNRMNEWKNICGPT